jgi:hypothetical protein
MLYFLATTASRDGGHLTVGPYWSLPGVSSLVEKGQLVQTVIYAYMSRDEKKSDPMSLNLDPELARLSGLKTWNQFERGARSCSLTEEHGQLTIQPWKNLGYRKGFGSSGAPNVVVPFDASNEEIGQALEEAFSRAT